MSAEYFVNFDEAHACNVFIIALRRLRGKYRIKITKYRLKRSDKQNKRYWAAIVAQFADWLREQGNEFTNLQAHELLKYRFLRKTFVDTKTGEALDYTRSTTELDTAEFNQFMDAAENWLAEFCGIIVPEEVTA